MESESGAVPVKMEEVPLQENKKSEVKCQVCQTEIAKYKCPRCQKQTCSLPCVKRHKVEEACSGERDKTAFVAIKQFTQTHLVSDIHFLEDGDRKVSTMKRTFHTTKKYLSKRLQILYDQSRNRGLNLKLMPPTFSRHQQNTSIYYVESKSILWRVEWIFPTEELTLTVDRFSEVEPVWSGVEKSITDYLSRRSVHSHTCKYLSSKTHTRAPEEAQLKEEQDKEQDGEQEDKKSDGEETCDACRKTKQYLKEGGHSYRVLMKVHGLQADTDRYYELDKEVPLKESLQQKMVIEFPSLYIVPQVQTHTFTTIDTEEEEKVMRQQGILGLGKRMMPYRHHGNRHHGNHHGGRGRWRHRPYNRRRT